LPWGFRFATPAGRVKSRIAGCLDDPKFDRLDARRLGSSGGIYPRSEVPQGETLWPSRYRRGRDIPLIMLAPVFAAVTSPSRFGADEIGPSDEPPG